MYQQTTLWQLSVIIFWPSFFVFFARRNSTCCCSCCSYWPFFMPGRHGNGRKHDLLAVTHPGNKPLLSLGSPTVSIIYKTIILFFSFSSQVHPPRVFKGRQTARNSTGKRICTLAKVPFRPLLRRQSSIFRSQIRKMRGSSAPKCVDFLRHS